MVTHDVSLKNYASKVVRMLDGKIQKIEEINPTIRQNAIQSLKENIEINYKNIDKKHNDNLGVREGTAKMGNAEHHEEKKEDGYESEKKEKKLTERRSPHDYPAIVFMK
jgi:ABC-type sulfate/molybdate transport systems ATPase subunit